MSKIAGILTRLHRIHRQITDLSDRIARGPRKMKAADKKVETLAEAVEFAKKVHTAGQVAADQKQLNLAEREARIKTLQSRLNTANSNKEFQTIKDQIAAEEQAVASLSDDILELLEKNDTLAANVQKSQAAFDQAKGEADELKKAIEKELDQLRGELQNAEQELAAGQAELPDDFRIDYQRIAESRGEEALAKVDNNTCGCCYQTITMNMLSDIMLEKPIYCANCGALLYIAEG